jgi:hypothetical protein
MTLWKETAAQLNLDKSENAGAKMARVGTPALLNLRR